ncbi:septum formation initiator family protein [Streptomyces sp. N2-109]|uniref:Septum formation initiator family protein n=1 Tax=Streptomyces gossypii TaxID=2883101 RepID=A0ABT2JZP2_9ACTN|nr:septum formation initiator family protein [Streptomyces gossypii]MCT2593377.1 septum formation initiator family protein [Streptomyces gossypii]
MTAQQRLARLWSLVPAGSPRAARAPFVLLVVVLLGSGLLALLLLNASLNNGSFELEELERKNKELSDEQQALEQEVGSFSAPGALEERARELGMVPGGVPAFLTPDGKVRGRPMPAPTDSSAPPAAPGAPAVPEVPDPSEEDG